MRKLKVASESPLLVGIAICSYCWREWGRGSARDKGRWAATLPRGRPLPRPARYVLGRAPRRSPGARAVMSLDLKRFHACCSYYSANTSLRMLSGSYCSTSGSNSMASSG